MKTITINNEEYVRKTDIDTQLHIPKEVSENYFMVRTYSAGVFAGELIERNGMEVKLKNARRMWTWEGAVSLSQLAMEGTSKPELCKFPTEVTEILLTQAIELIPCTEKAIKSIKGVPIWKN